jgi:hypothetical protein
MQLYDFIKYAGVIYTDRGNGSGGPSYIKEIGMMDDDGDLKVWDTEVTPVSEVEDPEAWMLAREAAKLLDLPVPTKVAVDAGAFGPSEYQGIYAE